MEEEFRLPPTYKEVAELIRAEIDKGTWPYGTQLPSASELSDMYGTSITTIHRAMKILIDAGDVIGRQGRGRFVTRR
ncbi:GntR family transcriptional regulator [Actinoplanes siamensis]|uniref:HTH gntR-type domain-containing protein n=1 Tax=Actinoplanes siamensis TaxID=1223317 RepID=A0A919N599_9ACTN|nr:GntR family transcriptional regulator [Actinoplanes siamensis]GIF04637.1 hypothetical protein Asi03nite_21750 [Actinoplanes siamensis]